MTGAINHLLAVHDLLDEMFFEHQRALLHFEFDRALAALMRYETHLLRHMSDEEKILIPLYAERCNFPAAGESRLFLDDHKKMRSFIELFLAKITDLPGEADPDRVVLQLLEREAFYLRLCSHHDKRERDFLYPLLDESLSDVKKMSVLESLDIKPNVETRLRANI